jgi:hypothetical protein
MAPDSLETDCPASGADIGDPSKAVTGEPMPSRPCSLFQIVCLQSAPQTPQAGTASL